MRSLYQQLGEATMLLPPWAVVLYGLIGCLCAAALIWAAWSYVDERLRGGQDGGAS